MRRMLQKINGDSAARRVGNHYSSTNRRATAERLDDDGLRRAGGQVHAPRGLRERGGKEEGAQEEEEARGGEAQEDVMDWIDD